MITLKAIVVTQLGGPEVLAYTDIEMPSVGPGQVLIRVEATSVNYADIKARYGNKGAGKLPFVPGLDAAGVVELVGSGVQRFKPGQRVIAFPKSGSYAEYAVADEALVFAVPDRIDFDVAAACPIVSFTSYQLLADVARMERGDTVLVHAAAGGIGTTAIQLAKLLGAGNVIGTVSSPDKMASALEAGADHVICYNQEDFANRVQELTNGHGANVILDSISGAVSEMSMRCLAPFGRLVHFGNSSGDIGRFQTIDLHASCRSVLGFSFGTTRSKRPDRLQEVAERVLPLIAEGQLRIQIGGRYALERASEAQAWVESRQSTGKVLLQVRG